ncbi:MAG: DNA polymerase III subunit delta [Acidobacteriia bacterium]|nr:DNA polymerase III subunit delta [Terriglobia bacterium]
MGPTEFIATLRKGKAGPAYFLRGPDRFLQEECRSAIAASLPAEAREWCLAEVEFEPGRLARELEGASQMPMLGGHSFFVFSDTEDFKRASDAEYTALENYLERPSPFATVVFIASEPDRRRRFIQLLEKKAQVVEMRPLVAREAAHWLEGYLSKRGVDIDPELAKEIAAKFEVSPDSRGEGRKAGVNLLWLRTEMEKLLTAKPETKRLERDDLDLLVAFREEHEIGKLLAALAERKFPDALAQLRALLASKEPETLLLWCIGDLIRQALKAGAQPGFGQRTGQYGAGRGGWGRFANPFSAQEIAPRALRNYSRQELSQALRLVRRADLGIKSSWKDSKILLEFLVWQIIVGKAAETPEYVGETLPAQLGEA